MTRVEAAGEAGVPVRVIHYAVAQGHLKSDPDGLIEQAAVMSVHVDPPSADRSTTLTDVEAPPDPPSVTVIDTCP